MLYTPRTKRKDTQTTEYSTNLSRVSKKCTISTSGELLNQSKLVHSGSNKEYQKIRPIATLNISVHKQKQLGPTNAKNNPGILYNSLKHKTSIITKKSTQEHGCVLAYGISTAKGFKNVTNPHFLSVNLGQVKNIVFAQSFDGQLAAKLIRQQFPIQLINLFAQKRLESSQDGLYQGYKKIQQKIVKRQLQNGDNSGSSFLSVLIQKQFITVANAGCSQAICGTRNGCLLKLAHPHSTLNQKQIKRVVKNGGTIYQTIVNFPYNSQIQLKGPLRVSPSGLVYTRCLGRAQNYKQLQTDYDSIGDFKNKKELSTLTWIPQIKYVKTSEVTWLGIFSESLLSHYSFSQIQSVVKKEMDKKSQDYSEHHIAQEISRKLVDQLINKGVPEAITAIIVFLSPIAPKNAQIQIINTQMGKNYTKKAQKLKTQNNVQTYLSYLGQRKSFIKQRSSSKGHSLSKMGRKNENDHFRNQNQLKRQFSFNIFN